MGASIASRAGRELLGSLRTRRSGTAATDVPSRRHGAHRDESVSRWKVALAEGMVESFVKLGPTYVKLGQLIASSPGLFPAVLADAALRCLDEVPPFPLEEVRQTLREDLGAAPEELFASFDPRPLAGASVAQVHACVLPDGREAVVKVQRPGIAETMNSDLRLMIRFARLVMRTEAGERTNVIGVVRDLHKVTNEELNFALEAHRQSRYRDAVHSFGDNELVVVPEVHWNWCGPRVVCMERLWGTPLDEVDGGGDPNFDGEILLRRGVKAWMEAALCHGIFHGDVHAGNLWVLDDGRVALLDFGIMGELDDEWREFFRNMQYTTMIDGDFTRVAADWRRVGMISDDMGTDEEVGARLKMVLEPLLSLSVGEVSMGEIMRQNLEMSKDLDISTPEELVLVTKQLLYFERYARTMAPGYNMNRDLYLVRNVFPDEVAKLAAERGIALPD